MISKIPSVFLLIVCIFLISSTNAVNLPGNYTVSKAGGNICFAARFDLVLNVEYLKIDGKKNTSRIPLNNETFQYYDGTCSLNNDHTLTIYMLDNLTSITFEFLLNEKNQTSLNKVYGSITVNDNTPYFVNHSANIISPIVFVANESLFATDRSHSYRCNSRTKVDGFKADGNLTIKSIDLENLRVQPFVDDSTTFHDYATEKICTMDYFKSSNLIPIIVGVCLGVLVVVVLVAYLIGRRRNRNGYQSV
jgi:hypothetical protein